jgi:hypothetical protein
VEAALPLRYPTTTGPLRTVLDPLQEEGVAVLHDRAGIDHLAVSAAGVFVIAAETDEGRVERRFSGGWLSRQEHLYVGGRDETSLVAAMATQRDAVASVLANGFEGIPIVQAICFTAADWSAFARPLQFGDVHVVSSRALVKMLSVGGPLDPWAIARIERELATQLPPG